MDIIIVKMQKKM